MAVIQHIQHQEDLESKPAEKSAHAELVARGLQWLQRRCGFAFAELSTVEAEIPDVWGFSTREGHSLLIECKTSRSDFFADAKKSFRRFPRSGMGDYRYYLCPDGLIKPHELPQDWGLLYCKPKTIRMVTKATWQESNANAERFFMAAALRRCALRWPIQDIQDPMDWEGRNV